MSTVFSPATFALAAQQVHRFFQPTARPQVVPDSSSVAGAPHRLENGEKSVEDPDRRADHHI
jgi:hypothetical protein